AEGGGCRPRHGAGGARRRGRRRPHRGRPPRAGGGLSLSNDTVLTVVLLGLAVYFSVAVARSLAGYLLFLKVGPTALLPWPGPRPAHFPLLIVLGFVADALPAINGPLHR